MRRAGIAAMILATAAFSYAQEESKETPQIDTKTYIPENPAQPNGALSGTSVFVNPGHGWFWTGSRWTTQRGLSHGIIEDHSNAEAVLQYLVKYLWNAGARVYTTRERCFNTNMVILEPGDEGVSLSGDWESEAHDGAYGLDHLKAQAVTGEATATITYTPDIPEPGFYGVYAWYAPSGSGYTAPATTFQVNHSGGTTNWVQNQNHDGKTWKYLGSYYFESGSNPESGSVTIDNTSIQEEQWITADAIRFGGGMGDAVRGGTTSGKPRWEESGLYYTEFMGYDPHEDNRRFNTVSAMPMLAEWEMEPWEAGKSIYVGWHTNASGRGTSRGMSSYIYAPDEKGWQPIKDFTGYEGGKELGLIVHNTVVDYVHKEYDPEWRDIGVIGRWLGETNPRNNAVMPAALYEYGFHDNAEDAAYILDPVFRDLVARATYHGIVKYFAEEVEGFENSTTLPDKPLGLKVTERNGNFILSWQPASAMKDDIVGDPASSFKVYLSSNGKGFDNGTETKEREFVLPVPESGAPVYARVTSINAGGESWPSETLVAIDPLEAEAPAVLIVSGYDRFDRGLNVNENGNERGIISRMNTYDYTIQHAEALEELGYRVHSISNEALLEEQDMLSGYDSVVWILGKEGKGSALTAEERQTLRMYLAQGGSLFISGAYLASDLQDQNQKFLEEILKAKVHDTVETDQYTFLSSPSTGIFKGLSQLEYHDRDAKNVYPVYSPDAIFAANGGTPLLMYEGTDRIAGVSGDGDYRTIFLTIPFESIRDSDARNDLMARSMDYLLRK